MYEAKGILIAVFAALSWTMSSALAFPQTANTGDTKINEHGVATMPMSAAEEASERAENLDYMRNHPDAFPPALVDAIEAATSATGGTIRIIRLWGGSGHSDSGTIAINGGLPRALKAIVMAHEFEHATRAQGGGPGPGAHDPLTNDALPCGKCAHAEMRAADGNRAIVLTCSELYPLTAEEKAEVCNDAENSRRATSELLTKCYYAGCTSCCGHSYIPSVNELMPTSPCCQ